MRRALGAALAEGRNYSSAQVAQVLTRKVTVVYGNDYLANCPGGDVVNALKGNEADKTHIDYIQGYS
ncbi:hypothetical protein BDV29DRAFT_154844 [Aspergillus leporis]|uniref:Uncharacterized protein n=1 Tax=Aspergillus leporis TaxID=41062 RepID=A0A5N5X6J2_9EURO|nr:hypothetical protein BDV29DRAFT_154844 [Aspergillus leporis]